MNKPTKLVLALLVVAVVAGGLIVFTGRNVDENPSTATTQQSGNQGNTSDDSEANTDEAIAATIIYDGTNFKSSADRIKAGQKVRVINQSDIDLDFDSDPHPVHTDNPELNAGDIIGGGSKTFTITKKGTWGYHNHLNASQRGEIIVE